MSTHLSNTQKLTRVLIALTAVLGLTACTAAPVSEPATDRPVTRVLDYAAIESAIEDKITSGSLALSTINAVLVSVDGESKVAHYRNESKPQDALHVWSVTKSIVSALIGIAIDEKIISGLDATLLELLPRYQKYLNAEQKSITLRQLMSMTAGFPSGELDKIDTSLRTANRSNTEHPDRRLGQAACRSLWLFEYWRTPGVRRATRGTGPSRW